MKRLDAISNARRVKEFLNRHNINPSITKFVTNIFSFSYGTFLLILNKISNKKRQFSKRGIALIAICKNESEYILEWIAFHKAIGIDHIYIYDNGSTDSTVELIQSKFSDDFITIINFPGIKMQYPAYNDAINNYGSLYRYLAFIDCDEFIVPSTKGVNLVEQLDSLTKKDELIGGVCLNWVVYGSSGFRKKPDGLVLENYMCHGDLLNGTGNQCIKTILMPEKVKYFKHAHYPVYKPGYYPVNINGIPVDGWRSIGTQNPSLRINHYFTKSLEEWIKRRSLGKADKDEYDKRSIDEFRQHDDNSIEDHITDQFIADIKALLKD